jgi:hypothetical protein
VHCTEAITEGLNYVRPEFYHVSCLLYAHIFTGINKKVKFALEEAMKAQSGSRCSSTLSLTSALVGMGG